MAKQIKPKEQQVLQNAQHLLSQNNAAEAKNVLLKFTNKNKPNHQTVYMLTLCRAVLGETQEAQGTAEKLVKAHPNNIEYLKLLGSIYHELHLYDNAITTFTSALNINNKDFQTLSNMASSLKEINNLDDAEKYYKRSLAIQPNQPDTLTNYGLLLQNNAQLSKAIEHHNKSLQLSPNNPHALYNLAHVLSETGDKPSALSVYNKVINLIPNHVRALCDAAHLHLLNKNYDDAISCLERAIAAAPDDEDTHIAFANLHRIMKNFDLAKASFDEVFRINPNHEIAKYYLATFNNDSDVTSSPEEYVKELFDTYAETFDDQLIGKLKYKTPVLIGEMVHKHLDTDKKHNILDLGCGTGLAGVYLKDISENMVGVDLSPKMLKKAKERNLYNELVASGIEQYYETHDFKPSIVVSADVFVYIGDISAIFTHTSNAMQKDGLFVFSTEDTDTTNEFLLRDSGRFAHNEKYIQSLANANQFTLIDKEKTILRYDNDEPIYGQVYLLKKQ